MKYVFAIALAATLALAAPSHAHHSTSLYVDVSKTATVTGVLSDIKFINPHVVLHFSALNDKGDQVTWSGETHSPSALQRLGWRADMFHKGDKVTVSGNPSRDGSPYLQLTEVVFADGYHLSPAKLNPPRAAH